jgi:lipopolysaccharide transport protein LptA
MNLLADIHVLLVILLLLSTSASAQIAQGVVTLEGTRGDIDIKGNTTVLYNAVVRQDDLVLAANRLKLNGGLEDGRWTAQGPVQVHNENALIVADWAELEVRNKAVRTIHFTGAPVKLQQKLADSRVINGHADDVKYDLENGLVSMTGNGYFSLGATQISAESITYDIKKGLIVASGGANPNGQVHLIIDPTANLKIGLGQGLSSTP